MALCCIGIGAEKQHFRAIIADNNRVAGQVNVNLTRKGNNVFSEHIRLGFTGG